MQTNKEVFLEALHHKRKVEVTFTKKNGEEVTRLCAPLDFGPKRNAKGKKNLYHFWSFPTPEKKGHPLSINPQRVSKIELSEESFDPGEFVSWIPEWHTPRDWGDYS
ncbi:MAG TPA: hypothetical protein DCE42_05295 [Myxococcales bacterium]|nr:hypothetical protein [Deltaproteobacteria bacterium]MBK07337.1 hypothetical protein [Deltaproteobacteria bacterium]MBU53245.1 hypothetical protein [Deltaproteobacteria bacterium]HAA54147.1 hypothetical protein [Myxococcales bacterium]|tara:strand:- start:4322 stop:4642 length:321 start_codon:yes stop_codon:yes gene_type:complete